MFSKINDIINRKPDILNGRIWKSLLLLSIPIVVSNLFHTLYNITDAFWLGKLGKTALAAPTITFSTLFTLIALASGLAIGGTTLVGQFKGAGDEKSVDKAAGNTFTLIFIIALILGGAGFLLSEKILILLQTPEDAFTYTLQYMRITFAGVPFVFGYFIFQGIMQGYGNTVTPMKINAITVALNIILDPILIFGLGPFPRMEVMGAGIATITSQFIASLIGIYFLFSGRYGVRIHLPDLKLKWNIVKNILKIGLPVSFSQAGTALGFTLLMGLVNTLGSSVVSAFGVGNRIISLLTMPAMGLANGNGIMVAQNIGAGNLKRAEKTVWTAVSMNLVILFVLTTLLFFFGQYVVKFFISDPEVINIGARMFRITSYSVLFFSIMIIFNGAFQGSGHTVPVFVLQIGRLWGLRIPFAYLFVKLMGMGYDGIFWAMFISNSVITFAAYIWYKSGTWKKSAVNNIRVQDKENVLSDIET